MWPVRFQDGAGRGRRELVHERVLGGLVHPPAQQGQVERLLAGQVHTGNGVQQVQLAAQCPPTARVEGALASSARQCHRQAAQPPPFSDERTSHIQPAQYARDERVHQGFVEVESRDQLRVAEGAGRIQPSHRIGRRAATNLIPEGPKNVQRLCQGAALRCEEVLKSFHGHRQGISPCSSQ
jgi:hypothetical protein